MREALMEEHFLLAGPGVAGDDEEWNLEGTSFEIATRIAKRIGHRDPDLVHTRLADTFPVFSEYVANEFRR
jgi:hypothetical protein